MSHTVHAIHATRTVQRKKRPIWAYRLSPHDPVNRHVLPLSARRKQLGAILRPGGCTESLCASHGATRIARRPCGTASENAPPSHYSFSAVAPLHLVAFASLELIPWGRLACASVPVMPRSRVKCVETVIGAAHPHLTLSGDLAAPATASVVKSVAASANSIAAVLLQ